jgi:hypothetical protein
MKRDPRERKALHFFLVGNKIIQKRTNPRTLAYKNFQTVHFILIHFRQIWACVKSTLQAVQRSAPTLLKHGPPHIITIFLGVHARLAGDLFSLFSLLVSLFSAGTRRAIRFWVSLVYSIAVPHVTENARNACVFPLVSGVPDRPWGCDANATGVL